MSDTPRCSNECPVCCSRDTDIIFADEQTLMLHCNECKSDTATWPLIEANRILKELEDCFHDQCGYAGELDVALKKAEAALKECETKYKELRFRMDGLEK